MFERTRAWKELLKLGLNVTKLRTDINRFFRGNVIRVLRKEGWFEYLESVRTEYEIASHFQYTDVEFLKYLLSILVEDKSLLEVQGKGFQINGTIEEDWVCPSCFDGAMEELWVDQAQAIPNRLRGQYLTFTGGLNLFNWDDALANKLYEQIRRSAFEFANALKKPGRFLDIGSGNGRGTAAIWSYYFNKGCFTNGNGMSIVGIEPSDRLNEIAEAEFARMVSKRYKKQPPPENIINHYAPEFLRGYAEAIPFDDNEFDIVFASQVLHWTKPSQAIREMIRVTKPGGFIFGTQNFHPDGNMFNEVHFKVIEGAHGFFHRDEMTRWAEEAGAKKIEIATPIAVYKISI